MERMGQPIADAYETVQSAVGSAMNVVFQLSSWFTDYETAPYTIISNIGDDGVSYCFFNITSNLHCQYILSYFGQAPVLLAS